ncbi:hypothetical protein GALMADRAFT_55472 [Galerina marginata CBS 339.88]|uniref:Uncharacterized protein n=1 Tax=Galerina marginata (strain CBS 339.88) TaxID=685588 RepID=A0A067TN00_GALM3|nr:hypothetical protein GALMADRAFT_55472 [Galerina marginata CBS 339.88]
MSLHDNTTLDDTTDVQPSSAKSGTNVNRSFDQQSSLVASNNAVCQQPQPATTTVEVVINTPISRSIRASSPPLPSSQQSKPAIPMKQISQPEISGSLPGCLYSCLDAQKRAIIRSLRCSMHTSVESKRPPSVNDIAARQLTDLIDGSVGRAEGNSCLLLGPRGSGKSRMIEACLENTSTNPIVLRLSGWVQHSDRHALREIAFQLFQQTGSSLLSDLENVPFNPVPETDQEDDNPFLDGPKGSNAEFGESPVSLPPFSHLHALIPALLTLKRPVIVMLDAFDQFALHPRQSLLYCLLDTVQNCRASAENRGIAVIGITSRLDTIQLLEKRVKSRFSGRIIRTSPSSSFQSCLTDIRNILQLSTLAEGTEHSEQWNGRWTSSVENFLADEDVLDIFKETFSLSKDPMVIHRILASSVLQLNVHRPYLSYKLVATSVESQRSRLATLNFAALPYPSTCLLIASVHINTGGHPTFTFEMLFDTFRDQLRASMSAPVQVNGGSIGMAFEGLTASNVFVHVAGPSFNASKEFVKHRCAMERDVVKKIVEKSGQVNLKKWLNKAQ